MNCEHIHFVIYGTNKIGFGTCTDCKEEINLAILFNGLAQRLQTLEARLTERLHGETPKA